METHDVVVIGASAGGVAALEKMLGGLPQSLAAAVFLAVHTHPSSRHLVDVLEPRSPLPIAYATHGDRIRAGCAYVAPADNHLIVRTGRMEVVRGPRENGHRPSVDVLFRTAAKAYGPRVIGVVLSGHRDCGTAGLLSIKARGGLALVQDPEDAHAAEMPASAVANVSVDHVAPAARLPELLAELVATPAAPPHVDETGVGTDLGCPLCSGRFRASTLAKLREYETERALWAAARSLDDGANLSKRLASDARGELRERFVDRARDQARDAEVIRELLVGAKRK